MEEPCPLQADVHVIKVQVLPAGLALPDQGGQLAHLTPHVGAALSIFDLLELVGLLAKRPQLGFVREVRQSAEAQINASFGNFGIYLLRKCLFEERRSLSLSGNLAGNVAGAGMWSGMRSQDRRHEVARGVHLHIESLKECFSFSKGSSYAFSPISWRSPRELRHSPEESRIQMLSGLIKGLTFERASQGFTTRLSLSLRHLDQ